MLRDLIICLLLTITAALRVPSLPRRHVLGLAAATPFAPLAAIAGGDPDKLVAKLQSVRQNLVDVEPALGTDPSKVRDAVASALFPMTIKGYLGDSVKARAVDLKEAGQDEKAGALKRERLAVLKALNAVDTYCFEQQTGKQPSGAPPAEVKAQLEAAVSSLDSVITQAVAARELLGS